MRKLIILICLMLLTTGGGCRGRNDEMKSEPDRPKVKTEKIAFEPWDLYKAPDTISKYAETVRTSETVTLLEDGGVFWVLVTRGVKPTGGYSVRVSEVFLDNGEDGLTKLRVYYTYKDPSPDQFVTQVLTTPLALARLKGLKNKPDQAVFIKK